MRILGLKAGILAAIIAVWSGVGATAQGKSAVKLEVDLGRRDEACLPLEDGISRDIRPADAGLSEVDSGGARTGKPDSSKYWK